MVNIQSIALSLVEQKATVDTVARTFGSLGKVDGSEFMVATGDPSVLQASIGIPQGQDASAAPRYVKIYFQQTHPISVATAVPFCDQWERMPSNPGATTYSYACEFWGSNAQVSVRIIAELDGEVDNAKSQVKRILLQRNALQ